MNSQEKAIARILFQNKIFKADGQKFEDLFVDIMSYAETDFRKIKAWGNVGDRKNDGYIESKGIYYQVYAPEELRIKYPNVIKKLSEDFDGLLKQWDSVKEFYFVVNDKYNGVNPDAEQALKSLKNQYGLNESGLVTADNLERILFSLDEDKIEVVAGFIPNLDNIVRLDYSVLNEVIGYIMELSINPSESEIKFPDWDEKIVFNDLSAHSAFLLNFGSQNLGALNKYLAHNSFLADELQIQITGVYSALKEKWIGFTKSGDNLFWEVVYECSPKQQNPHQMAVVTIMSKYFESCDIFEEPEKENE